MGWANALKRYLHALSRTLLHLLPTTLEWLHRLCPPDGLLDSTNLPFLCLQCQQNTMHRSAFSSFGNIIKKVVQGYLPRAGLILNTDMGVCEHRLHFYELLLSHSYLWLYWEYLSAFNGLTKMAATNMPFH